MISDDLKLITIKENSPLVLDKQSDADAFTKFKQDNLNIPFEVRDNIVFFDSYIIGSICINNLLVNIEPRIKSLNINDYFEMQLYTEGIIDESIESLLKENSSFGIERNLVTTYLNSLEILVKSGLDGNYINISDVSKYIRGRVKSEEISNIHIINEVLPIEYQIFSIDVCYNQLLKLALEKIRLLIQNNESRVQYSQIFKAFDKVNTKRALMHLYMQKVNSINYFENKKYSKALQLAVKILEELNINFQYSQGDTTNNYSYLINSNTVFEKYVRAILRNNLSQNVLKWDKGKEVATVNLGENILSKSIIPDVMIDYSEDTNSTFVVLDVKNKDISDHNNLIDLQDLYQILFYSENLRCQLMGLVYPSKDESVDQYGKVNVAINRQVDLYYFLIDFDLSLANRHKQFINNLKNVFHVK